MVLFPFFQDIEGKTFLVVGGGRVAKEKVEKILKFTDRIIVVAGDTDIAADGIKVVKRDFEDADIELGDICIAATSDRAINAHIAGLCQKKDIPVDVIDDKDLCTFVFPGVIKKGDLTVGVTTSGKSPLYAGLLRRQIEDIVPDNIEEILDCMSRLKDTLKGEISDQKERSGILRTVLDMLLETGGRVSADEIKAVINDRKKDMKNEET